MKLKDYLELTKQKPNHFAQKHGLNQAMVYAYLAGKRQLYLSSAIAISQATQGIVSVEELNDNHKG